MATNYIYSSRDHKFILKEWLDLGPVLGSDRYKNSYGIDDIDPVLDNALKVAREVLAPCNDDGDALHARYENGRVKTPDSYKKAYFFVQENGLGSSNKDHHDESALPCSIFASCSEYLAAANPGLGPYFMATTGAAGLVQKYGSEKVKQVFLAKMFSGQWAGTMDLTEPGGGSDVGDILTRAYPTDAPGVYRIVGTKCFITGGEQDITENIVHLTLARIEGAAPGTRGISLFVVPKYWPDEKGGVGSFNDVSCAGIEHKMGLRGSSTAVVSYGEEGHCRGYLLGDPPGEDGTGQGMAQMFDMMNEERMVTGHAATALATIAYNNAAQYASQRIQGRKLTNPKGGRVPIIKHEDVRRMLMFQKAHIDAFRALIIFTYHLLDLAETSTDPEVVKRARATIEVHTPIIKAYCSDLGFLCISEAMQVYGGYGYSEEYPVAQILRDSRIYAIWEGTNFIQALDLVGRKWTMGKGQVFTAWLKEIAVFVGKNQGAPGLEREFAVMQEACQHYQDIYRTVGGYAMTGKLELAGLYATRILHATGKLICGKILLDQALLAKRKMEEIGSEHHDYPFYQGKVASARFYVRNIVPEIETTLKVVKDADTSAIEVPEEALLLG
ncbi:MAG: acyl-CoA dehydrogenase [Firmicutes bacterium]|nr:acyl-CoA dehydrogenase [Bacillota bacterium]